MKTPARLLGSAILCVLPLVALGAPKRPANEGKVGYQVSLGGSTFVIWQVAPTGNLPKGASITHDGKRLFITNFGRRDGKTISVFHADPLRFERYIGYAGNSIESVVSPDDKLLYSTNMKSNTLDVIDLTRAELTRQIKIGGFPKVIALDPKGERAYLSLWIDRAVVRVDLATGEKRKVSYTTTDRPRGLAVTRDGKLLFVANNRGRTVTVVDTATMKVKQHIPVRGSPRHLVLSRDGKRVYVSAMGFSSLGVIDVETLKLVRFFRVGERPKTIEDSYDGRFIYTANYTGHSMSIVDTRDWKVRDLPLDVYKTSGLVVHPNDRYVYITSWCSDEVFAIRRFDEGETVTRPTAKHPGRRLCRTCPSPLLHCPHWQKLYGPPPK